MLKKPIEYVRNLYQNRRERYAKLVRETAEIERIRNQDTNYRFGHDHMAPPIPAWFWLLVLAFIILMGLVCTGHL